MGRRLLTALVLAGLAAAAWWIVRADEGPAEGLVVYVEVADEAGVPVEDAQLERVFEGQRLRVDSRGRARLTHVVLRELDRPSPVSIARAVRIHAPYHALRRGSEPTIAQRADGAWTMRVPLHAHGVLRLYVEETHLGPCKAYPEADPDRRRWEPIAGRQVARFGAPASYRIYAGMDEVVVRIEGEADRDGAIGVATRKVFLEPPAAGHVIEKVLKPEEVQVILGQVNVGDGPEPPSLAGLVRVTEIAEDGRRIPLAIVRVPDDGRFLARRTGKGSYELEADLDFFPGTTTLTVLGGGSFDLTPSQPAVWAVIRHGGVDLRGRTARVRVEAADPGAAGEAALLRGEAESHVPLPGPGTWRILITVYGTSAQPPLRGGGTFEAEAGKASGPASAFVPLPHGTIVVHASKDAFGKARGATVHVGGRTKTLIPGLAEKATFKHIVAGSHKVRIEWDQVGRPASTHDAVVAAGGTVTVNAGDGRP